MTATELPETSPVFGSGAMNAKTPSATFTVSKEPVTPDASAGGAARAALVASGPVRAARGGAGAAAAHDAVVMVRTSRQAAGTFDIAGSSAGVANNPFRKRFRSRLPRLGRHASYGVRARHDRPRRTAARRCGCECECACEAGIGGGVEWSRY